MSTITTAPARPTDAPRPQVDNTPRKSQWGSVLHWLPNLVVFSLLGGVLYYGHHSGWKMPTVSTLLGTSAPHIDDWCSEHLVPESLCIECKPELYPKPKSFGFCQEHGVAECVIHHPELAQVKDKPQLPKYDTSRAIGLIARPENNSRNTLHTQRVQFVSADSVTKLGIDVDVVQEARMMDAISANGELTFDPTRVTHLSARAHGTVAFVFKTIGDAVRPGDILALVDAAQVGQAKTQLLQATVQVELRKNAADRLRGIAKSGAIAQKSLIEAEASLQEAEVSLISARQALTNLGFEVAASSAEQDPQKIAEDLRFLGIPTSLAASLPKGTSTANLIPVRASYDGVVVASEVVAGEVVETSKILFTVADPQKIWLLLNVAQESAKYIKRGLQVRFRTDDEGQEVSGQIAWISPSVDEQTRTLKVRVTVENPEGKLRDHTFGAGQIVLREEPNAIVVPKEAVQSTSDAHFVFVRDKNYFDEAAPKVFHVRQVRMGARDGQRIELLAGVLPGEVVATKGSSVILAQLLRSSLGAGCGCHQE